MTLRVGMVARSLNVAHVRGTGRYVQEVLRHTRSEDGVAWTALSHDPDRPLHLPPNFQGTVDVFEMRGHRLELWEQIGLPMRLKRHGIQVLHGADNTLPLWQPVPAVVTIHDVVPWLEPLADPIQRLYLHRLQSLAFDRCAAVITISQNSRRDIEARWPQLARKTVVIPHGIAQEFLDAVPQEPALMGLPQLHGRPYLLYLGGPQPRKRFDWALQLLARCSRQDLQLVACGFAADVSQRPALAPDLAPRVHFAPYVEDRQLVALYRGAQACLYPTRYEGFGFPAIESQAAGTPVIFSAVSSLVDLVGPLSWTVPLDDFEAWQSALEDILALPLHARGVRAAQALQWARGFSWRRSAQAHVELYGAVARRELAWA